MRLKLFFLVLVFSPLIAFAQTEEEIFRSIKWQSGPAKGQIGDLACIQIPEGYRFIGAEDSRKFLELCQNPTSGNELGVFANDDLKWFVVFEFSDIGYVRDSEKDKLDPDAILKSLREGNASANEERKRRGWPTMTLTGWVQNPHYDPQTNNLEWAIKGESDGSQVMNYNTRILGRSGVMSATLVGSPESFPQIIPKYKEILSTYSYTKGNTYAEFKKGDKIAKYGLTALIVGGAAAAAAKGGLFKGLYKLIIVIGIAILAAFKKIVEWIKRLFTGR